MLLDDISIVSTYIYIYIPTCLHTFSILRRLKAGFSYGAPTGLKAGALFLEANKGCGAQWFCTQNKG